MPSVLWKTLIRRCESAAALSDFSAFVAHEAHISCFDKDGRTLWSAQVGPTQGAPLFDPDSRRVYLGTDAGLLLALDAKSGRVAWKAPLGAALKSAPALGGATLFVEATDGAVHAIEQASGTPLWKFSRPDGSLGFGAPLPVSGAALFVPGETTLYRLDPAGGALVWKSVVGGKAISTPARGEGRLILGGDASGAVALSEDDGRRLWRFPASGKTTDWYGAPLLHKGIAYVGTVRGLVYALDAATGKRLWATSLTGEALARPALDEPRGLLWTGLTGVPEKQNSLVALDVKTGKVRAGLALGEVSASPVIANDRLYVGSLGGFFYACSLK